MRCTYIVSDKLKMSQWKVYFTPVQVNEEADPMRMRHFGWVLLMIIWWTHMFCHIILPYNLNTEIHGRFLWEKIFHLIDEGTTYVVLARWLFPILPYGNALTITCMSFISGVIWSFVNDFALIPIVEELRQEKKFGRANKKVLSRRSCEELLERILVYVKKRVSHFGHQL